MEGRRRFEAAARAALWPVGLYVAVAAASPCAAQGLDDNALRGLTEVDSAPAGAQRESAPHGAVALMAVTIDGARAFTPAQLASAYEAYLTRPVTMGDLVAIAQAVTERYRAEGYFLSQAVVPEQDLQSGVARIVVIEGRISAVVVEGDGAALAAPYLHGLGGEGASRLGDIDRQLALANDVPGLSVRTRVEPDIDDPSRHRLVASARLKRLSAYATLDNRGSDAVGPVQGYARLAANSLFSPGDQLSLSMFATPSRLDEFAMAQSTYVYAFDNGARVGVSASVFKAKDGADPVSPELGGDGEALQLRFEGPLARRRGRALWAGGSFDARAVRYDWAGGEGYADELRVARVFLRGLLDESGRSSTLFVQGSFGLDVLGASGASASRRSRADADGRFAKVNLHLTHYGDIGRLFGLYLAADAQVSADPLLYSEEFAVGGPPYGRGYDYGEISGDHGLGAMAELRAGYDPDLAPITFAQGYVFFDAAQIWNIDAPTGADSASLASAGVGVRLRFADRLTVGAELARPLTRTPAAESDKDWRPRISLSATY